MPSAVQRRSFGRRTIDRKRKPLRSWNLCYLHAQILLLVLCYEWCISLYSRQWIPSRTKRGNNYVHPHVFAANWQHTTSVQLLHIL